MKTTLIFIASIATLASAVPWKRQELPSLPGLPLPEVSSLPLPTGLPVPVKRDTVNARQELPGLPSLLDLPLPSLPALPIPSGLPIKRDAVQTRQTGQLPDILSILSDLSIPLGEPLSQADLSNLYKVLDQFVGAPGAPLPGKKE